MQTMLSTSRMSLPSTPRLASLEAGAQAAMVQFLTADLELAFTMVELAHTHRLAEHRERSLSHAKTALSAIRYFVHRIKDPERQRIICARADELEAAITTAEQRKEKDEDDPQ